MMAVVADSTLLLDEDRGEAWCSEHQSKMRKSPQSYYLVCYHPFHFMNNTSIMKEN